MNDRLFPFLGLARKAGKLHLGLSAAISFMSYNSAEVILISEDLSKNTLRKLMRTAEKFDIHVVKLKVSMVTIENALGKMSGIVTVTDRSFAKKIFELVKSSNT